MADIRKELGNIAALADKPKTPTNRPAQYGDRRNPYFGDATARFAARYGKYASDYTACRMQGLSTDPANFYEWADQMIRMADVRKGGNAVDRPIDNYKEFLVVDPRIEYVPEGAKVETMGSIWLVTNPANISSAVGGGVMRRCNAAWNHLDWYGNVRKEPLVLESVKLSANANDFQETVLMMQGYFNIIMQLNEDTRQLDINSRLMLGRAVYQITGYTDAAQEFTGDEDSCHLLRFTARLTEPDREKDDLARRVANAYPFAWTVSVSGEPVMSAGETAQFAAHSLRNGANADGDAAHPASYLWRSSDESVCTVNDDGAVTAVGNGVCRVTAALEQNEAWSGEMVVSVESGLTGVRFTQDPVSTLEAYREAELTAVYVESGAETAREVRWEFSGADTDAYTATVRGNSATVKCWGGSVTPLTVRAVCGEYGAQTEIVLEGW